MNPNSLRREYYQAFFWKSVGDDEDSLTMPSSHSYLQQPLIQLLTKWVQSWGKTANDHFIHQTKNMIMPNISIVRVTTFINVLNKKVKVKSLLLFVLIIYTYLYYILLIDAKGSQWPYLFFFKIFRAGKLMISKEQNLQWPSHRQKPIHIVYLT